MIQDMYTIFWRELVILRKRLLYFLAGNIISPLLFLTAFGWGLGKDIQFAGGSYMEFVVPGIVALTAMNTSYNATGFSLHVCRIFYKTLEEFLVSPINVCSLVLGSIFGGCLRGVLSVSLILVLAYFFGAHLHYNIGFFVVLLLTCFIFSALGVVAAMLFKTHEDMSNFGTFVILPMGFLCGTFFQLESLPSVIVAVINVLPLTHSAIFLRMSVLDASYPLTSLLVLIVYALLFLGLSVWLTARVE